jgi:hypothetical protein
MISSSSSSTDKDDSNIEVGRIFSRAKYKRNHVDGFIRWAAVRRVIDISSTERQMELVEEVLFYTQRMGPP